MLSFFLRHVMLFMLVLGSIKLFAQQNEPLVINDSSGQYPRSFPFDKSFDVKYIPKQKIPIKYVGLFRISRDGCLADVTSKKCIKREVRTDSSFKNAVKRRAIWDSLYQDTTLKKLKNKDSFKVAFNSVWNNLKRDNRQLRHIIRDRLRNHRSESVTLFDDFSNTATDGVRFTVPPLQPSKRYMFVCLTHSRIEGIQEVVDELAACHDSIAKTKYDKILDATTFIFLNGSVNSCQSCFQDFKIQPFDAFKAFFIGTLKKDVVTIKHLQDSLKKAAVQTTLLKKTSIDATALHADIKRAVVEYSQQCLHCKDTIWQSEYINKNTDIVTALLRLEEVNDTSYSYGYRDIYSNDIVNNTKIKADKRLLNLQTTAGALVQLQRVMDYYHVKYRFNNQLYQRFKLEIKKAIDTLSANIVYVTAQQKTESSLEKGIASLKQQSDSMQQNADELFRPMSKFSSGTFTYSFDTRTGFLIKPDFGFLYYGSLKKGASFKGFAPYLGFHINFRPLDTDIPFGTIHNEGALGHLSFNAGALLGSFAETGTRDGLIGNTAIFTGLGWAFTEWLRVTSGAVWYRKEDASPLKTRKTTAAVPYVSVSFDLRLRGIYDAFLNIFPQK